MNGKAVSLPKPAYPQGAMAVGASGSVSVQVTIDESGKVVSAVPVSGHPLLRAAAAQAANGATFTPTMMSGQPVKVTGVITYNFGTAGTTIVANPGELVGPLTRSLTLTPQEIRDRLHKKKLHAWLYAVLQRNTSPTPNESSFVRDGRASISLTLTKPATPKLVEELRALGFEVVEVGGTSVTGTIAVEKLRELADVEEIKYILPRAIDGL